MLHANIKRIQDHKLSYTYNITQTFIIDNTIRAISYYIQYVLRLGYGTSMYQYATTKTPAILNM